MAKKTYKINEGGEYYVNSVNGDIKTKSNDVEVPAMTTTVSAITLTRVNGGVTANPSIIKAAGTINIVSPIVGAEIVGILRADVPSVGDTLAGGSWVDDAAVTKTLTAADTSIAFSNANFAQSELDVDEYSFSAGKKSFAVYVKEGRNYKVIAVGTTFTKVNAAISGSVTPYTRKVKFTVSGGFKLREVVSAIRLTSGSNNADVNLATGEVTVPVDGTYSVRMTPLTNVDDSVNLTLSTSSIVIASLGAPVLSYNSAAGQLEWEEVSGADSYEVYRDGAKIGDVT